MANKTPSEVVLSPYLIWKEGWTWVRMRRRMGRAAPTPGGGWGDAPTLFSACTAMLEASISRRSRSASYLRSLETLNLRAQLVGVGPTAGRSRPPQGRRAGGCGRGRSPQGLLAAPQVVLQDDAGHGAPLAHACAVADEEARALPAGEQDLVLLRAGNRSQDPRTGRSQASTETPPTWVGVVWETPVSPGRRR